MKDKQKRLIYIIATSLLSLLMLFSAGMYFFNHDVIAETFTRLGYPSYIIYPLAILKIFGLIAIWSKKSNTLREWAYAGFFFDFVLAFSAHIHANDGEYIPSLIAILLLITSYISGRKQA